jgi:hypothetical protein
MKKKKPRSRERGQVHPGGSEHPAISSGNSQILGTGGAKSGAVAASAGLDQVVQAWPKLTARQRASILAVVRRAAPGGKP